MLDQHNSTAAPIQNTGAPNPIKPSLYSNAPSRTFISLCEAHTRVMEVQALIEATMEKALTDASDVYSALGGIKRLMEGISEQVTQVEREVSDLERQLKKPLNTTSMQEVAA